MLGGACLDLRNSGTYDFTEFQHLQLSSPTDVKPIFYIHLYRWILKQADTDGKN